MTIIIFTLVVKMMTAHINSNYNLNDLSKTINVLQVIHFQIVNLNCTIV